MRSKHKGTRRNARIRQGGTWAVQVNRLDRQRRDVQRRGLAQTWAAQANRLDRDRRRQAREERRARSIWRKLFG